MCEVQKTVFRMRLYFFIWLSHTVPIVSIVTSLPIYIYIYIYMYQIFEACCAALHLTWSSADFTYSLPNDIYYLNQALLEPSTAARSNLTKPPLPLLRFKSNQYSKCFAFTKVRRSTLGDTLQLPYIYIYIYIHIH